MNFAAAFPALFTYTPTGKASRTRLYGLCVLVGLSGLLLTRLTNDFDLWVPTYLPLAGLTVLLLFAAGIECQLYIQHITSERAFQQAERERTESSSIERQRAFNSMWQELANSRGSTKAPDSVLTELTRLFQADLVAVWTVDQTTKSYRVCGTSSGDAVMTARLDKIANASPCFDTLRSQLKQIRLTDFKRESTPAMAWFCEENNLQLAVMCPVLVRNDLVGVVTFFFRQKPKISVRSAEEMNSAANLFLCAF